MKDYFGSCFPVAPLAFVAVARGGSGTPLENVVVPYTAVPFFFFLVPECEISHPDACRMEKKTTPPTLSSFNVWASMLYVNDPSF